MRLGLLPGSFFNMKVTSFIFRSILIETVRAF